MGAEILSDYPCELGEGPTYDPASDTLWWFNITCKQMHEVQMKSREHVIHELPFMASAMGVIDREHQLLATENGLYIRNTANGSLNLHHPLEADDPTTRSNDGRVHQSGALWIGTMGKNAKKDAGAIYWFYKGELKKLYDRISIPNSICFSPDGGHAYFCDTQKEVIHRVAINPDNGFPVGETEEFVNRRGGKGGIDGSVCDAKGNIWNARWGVGKVDCYNPQGEQILSLDVPARQASCTAFVGKGCDRLAVTTAWQGMDEATRKQDARAGQTFLLPHAVEGRFEPHIVL